MLVVYNTQTRKKEEFKPWTPGQVKMYCCGPTVYGLLHVGNFRGAIFYNLVRNWLEVQGYKVTYVYNYTDVDDKIIDQAKKEGTTASEISERYIQEFQKDFARLKLRPHDHNPKVTEYMEPIQQMVGDLVSKNKAYVSDGEVLYSIKAFDGYGKLSNRNPDDLKAGVRIEVDRKKQDPLDFALWKPSKPGEPAWESPWGPGRPGWHIECSAMAKSILGEQIDIHGGGMDLIFPHHENEIAQSEGCSGKAYVKYWLHNNMLNFSGAKMSKSLGNIKTGRAFMDEYNPEIFKYMLLSVHYRSISDFGENGIDQAVHALARIYSALALAEQLITGDTKEDPGFQKITSEAWAQITESLNDDFNTPESFARVFEVIRQFNAQVKRGVKPSPAVSGKALALRNFVVKFGQLMSLFQEPAREFLITLDDILLNKKKLVRADIDQLVAARAQVRAAKDFKKSDELRDQLTAMGIAVSDTPEGSEWEVAK
ncbi:MAG: cysteine--tRNA ligase [Bdellovibrio sp. CG10_big_fil_rev_8_21_14_0_10_47_8]|nr:MAG: cysteine--tRNA ligase [Bdellovibrio sp. CG10_big_fil_rev_8_21_14_0_10_47_8]